MLQLSSFADLGTSCSVICVVSVFPFLNLPRCMSIGIRVQTELFKSIFYANRSPNDLFFSFSSPSIIISDQVARPERLQHPPFCSQASEAEDARLLSDHVVAQPRNRSNGGEFTLDYRHLCSHTLLSHPNEQLKTLCTISPGAQPRERFVPFTSHWAQIISYYILGSEDQRARLTLQKSRDAGFFYVTVITGKQPFPIDQRANVCLKERDSQIYGQQADAEERKRSAKNGAMMLFISWRKYVGTQVNQGMR